MTTTLDVRILGQERLYLKTSKLVHSRTPRIFILQQNNFEVVKVNAYKA